MRVPRDLGGEALADLLQTYGYEKTRQSGSHIRLTTTRDGEHHVTIPQHKPLKTGVLNAILGDVAAHCGLSKEAVMEELFG